MNEKINLSIILPALNEAEIIADTLQKVAVYLEQHPELGSTEVIVIAAGADETADIARGFAQTFTNLRVITPPQPLGKGSDVRAGFLAARGAIQIFFDVDLPTPLHHIAPMVELLRSGNDVVIGRRRLSKIHARKVRTMLSLASNMLIRTLFFPRVGDSQCGFKGFTAEAAKTIFGSPLQVNGWAFDVEVLALARRAAFRVHELPINDWHEKRGDDLRNQRLAKAAVRTLFDVLVLRLKLWEQSLVKHAYWVFAAATLLHAGLAWLIGLRQSIWFDESYSINLIEHSVGQIVRLTAVDVHPPLYYLALKAWSGVFGTSDIALRGLSILCGSGAVLIGLLLLKRLWDARTALYAVPFVVLAPFLLRYSFEIRMYAMASLICIGATYVLVAAMQAKSKLSGALLWLCYGVLVAAGMYTLYYTALVWVVHAIWYGCIVWNTRARWSWRTLLRQPIIWVDVGAVAAFGAWIPSFLLQLHSVQQWFWIGPVSYRTIVDTWSLTLSYLSEWQLKPGSSLIFMLGCIAAFYLVITAVHLSPPKSRQNFILLILYAIVPIVILYVVSLPPHRPLFTARYDSHVVLATYLLLGASAAVVFAARKSLLARLAVVGLLIILAQGIVQLYHYGNGHPNYRQMAEYLKMNAAPNQPIIVSGPQEYMIFHHYLPSGHIYFYSKYPIGTDGGYAMLHNSPLRLPGLATFANQTVWLMYSGPTPPYVPDLHARGRGARVAKFNIYAFVPAVKAPASSAIRGE